jgi:hypothetical protein
VQVLHCLKTEIELASETCFFKKLDDGQSPKKVCQLSLVMLLSILSTHDDLVIQVVQFRVIRFGGLVRSFIHELKSTSHM